MLGAVLPIALLAAACGGGDTATGGSSSPTVAIGSPADGATVGRSFDVKLDVNFPIGAPDTGRDHVHLYDMPAGQYGIAYAKTFTVTGLTPRHEIEAVVAHADHSTTGAHSQPITVTVSNSAASGATGGTTSTTNDGY